MNSTIKTDLYQELIHLGTITHNQTGYDSHITTGKDPYTRHLIDKSIDVLALLASHPYLTAKELADKTRLSKPILSLIFKLIQRSDKAQEYLKRSSNRDYFNVVKHYFDNRLFTAVFFVGTTCPSRCIYCPNVSVDSTGKRFLTTYTDSDGAQLKRTAIEAIFRDLNALKKNGTDVLVKISGGLEPLTDTRTITWITDLSNDIGAPVKLFTNGILLASKPVRTAALKTNDIRISLSTTDEDQYEDICFDNRRRKGRRKALKTMKSSILSLIKERELLNTRCNIGFNSIIMPRNLDQILPLISLAVDLGIDYVDFKPDYFNAHDAETQRLIEAAVTDAIRYKDTHVPESLYVNFTDSLYKRNFYWNPWKGTCDSIKQAGYKIFITPFGHCSPVHYGAFPHTNGRLSSLSDYSIGTLSETCSLSDILKNPARTPPITMTRLNPFELMLALEINREESDGAWGIPVELSPYHTSFRDTIPQPLSPNPRPV